MDYRLEELINDPAGHHPLLDTFMRDIAKWSEPVFIALVLCWFLIGLVGGMAHERQGAITAVLAAGGSLLVNQVIVHLWSRPRPFVAHPQTVHLLLGHSMDASFPSDHAAPAFAIATVFAIVHRRIGILVLLTAALLCYARVYCGIHYPADVIAGAIIGIAAALIANSLTSGFTGWLDGLIERTVLLLHLPMPTDAASRD